jgi:hypothetical protein
MPPSPALADGGGASFPGAHPPAPSPSVAGQKGSCVRAADALRADTQPWFSQGENLPLPNGEREMMDPGRGSRFAVRLRFARARLWLFRTPPVHPGSPSYLVKQASRLPPGNRSGPCWESDATHDPAASGNARAISPTAGPSSPKTRKTLHPLQIAALGLTRGALRSGRAPPHSRTTGERGSVARAARYAVVLGLASDGATGPAQALLSGHVRRYGT